MIALLWVFLKIVKIIIKKHIQFKKMGVDGKSCLI